MTLRVLIADDEPLARRRLRRLLSAEPEVQIAGECATGEEIIECAARLRPHLLLLDIEMPGLDGLGALDSLGPERPLVVFVTAHGEHAVRAFAENAVDYLLKPFSPARLREALSKVRLLGALRTLAQPSFADRIAVKSNGRIGIVR